jgi:hypothetical protein
VLNAVAMATTPNSRKEHQLFCKSNKSREAFSPNRKLLRDHQFTEGSIKKGGVTPFQFIAQKGQEI